MNDLDGKYCMLCGTQTHVVCAHCGHARPNDQYTQVEVQWSHGPKMMIGICVGCAVKNAHCDEANKALIGKLHHDHWEKKGEPHDREMTIV